MSTRNRTRRASKALPTTSGEAPSQGAPSAWFRSVLRKGGQLRPFLRLCVLRREAVVDQPVVRAGGHGDLRVIAGVPIAGDAQGKSRGSVCGHGSMSSTGRGPIRLPNWPRAIGPSPLQRQAEWMPDGRRRPRDKRRPASSRRRLGARTISISPLEPHWTMARECSCGTLTALRGCRLGAIARHPGFRRDILEYDPDTRAWRNMGGMPASLVTTGITMWQGRLVIAGGEDRPGSRSKQVFATPVASRKETR